MKKTTKFSDRFKPRTARGIAILYALFGLLWIVFSDRALSLVVEDAPSARFVASIKGAVFVLVSATVVYLLLVRRRIVSPEEIAYLENQAEESRALAETRERELTSVRAAQQALVQWESRIRGLISTSLDAIVTVGTDDLILEWNQEAERLFGWSAREAIGERLRDLIVPPELHERYATMVGKIIEREGTGTPMRGEETALRKDGSRFPIELTVAVLSWGDRVVITAFIRDISDRMRAEREAEHVRAIVNHAPFAMIGLDATERIVSWNPAAEQMYGWPAEEAIGKSIGIIMPPGETDAPDLADRIRWRIPLENQTGKRLRRDGRIIQTLWSLTPLTSGTGESYAALICVDLSERQQLETRLSDAEYLASLGRVAGVVAHEFNNVLMGIQPFVDLIARTSHEPSAVKAVAQMRLSIQRGRRVTEDILRFTRASAAPSVQMISANDWLKGVVAEVEAIVGPSIDVVIEPAADGLDLVADTSQLNQVVTNLAMNARDAMTSGGELRISAKQCAPPGGFGRSEACVELRVRDNGSGMDAATVARAFEPLFTTKRRGGTGLGLAVVQKIVHAHGGVVELDSTPGSGTEFRIWLPAVYASAHRPAPDATEAAFAPRRILLIEDDVVVAAGLADVLRSHGMVVHVLHSGVAAVAGLRAFTPDAVVLDVGLPDRSGIDVYRDIEAVAPGLPVIFSTGHADESSLQGPLSRPNVAFLRKPYRTEALLEEVERLVSGAVKTMNEER